MTTVEIGHRAEEAAAGYIMQLGFEILDRNWKVPKLCEIDLVASKQARLYFVEVKYRLNNYAGTGIDYITPQKIHHMRRAAAVWVRQHNFNGNYDLSAIEVTGPNMSVGDFIQSIY